MAEASALVRKDFRALLSDPDEGPLFWLALAAIQWRHGPVQPDVLEQVGAVVREERGLDRWREDAKALAKRQEVLRRFVEQVALPNERPKPLPKWVVRQAVFRAGDCLAIGLDDGRYAAAVVLAADNSRPEYGTNLMATLDYLSVRMPALDEFERRRWLHKVHGQWKGQQALLWCSADRFKRERPRTQLVGQMVLRADDQRSCNSFGGWAQLGEQVVLNRCHLGLPDDQ